MSSNRPANVAARKRAFEMARVAMKDPGLNIVDLAASHNADRHLISYALMVLQHGSEEEIAKAGAGLLPLREARNAIVARVPHAERVTKRKPQAMSDATKEARKFDSEVWQKLREGLVSINSLPTPKDMAAIVRKNPMRIEVVNRNLLAAITWIKEFEDEITK